MLLFYLSIINVIILSINYKCYSQTGGRRGCDRMVVGFTTTCAISTYHH
jgi:hypothetical protein